MAYDVKACFCGRDNSEVIEFITVEQFTSSRNDDDDNNDTGDGDDDGSADDNTAQLANSVCSTEVEKGLCGSMVLGASGTCI
jgi:hypothetical protein